MGNQMVLYSDTTMLFQTFMSNVLLEMLSADRALETNILTTNLWFA